VLLIGLSPLVTMTHPAASDDPRPRRPAARHLHLNVLRVANRDECPRSRPETPP
jgi:hypothetical protein